MKIFTINGEIIEDKNPSEIYLAVWEKDGFWRVSGIMYSLPEEVEPNLYNFSPDKILIIKVKIPLEERKE